MTSGERRSLGSFQLFAIAFGCVVGSSWVIVLGDWLRMAGPLGVVAGFGSGGIVLAATAASYAELFGRYPIQGGEPFFARQAFGDRAGFLTAWFLTLSLIAVAAFEGTALAWILERLFPGIQTDRLYTLFGRPITLDALVIGVLGSVSIAAINLRGVSSAARWQSVLTGIFLALAAILIVCGFTFGKPSNLIPLTFQGGTRPWWFGAAWIFATTSLFINGFQSVSVVIEARAPGTSLLVVRRAMFLAIAGGVLCYCLLTVAASMAVPWLKLRNTAVAGIAAFEGLPHGGVLGTVTSVAVAFSVIRLWIGASLWAAQLLAAQARLGFISGRFVMPDSSASASAIIFLCACNIAGVLAGRGALLPLVNLASMCLALTLVVTTASALRLRRSAVDRTETTVHPLIHWAGMVGSASMAAMAIIQSILDANRRIPLEMVAAAGWAVLGTGFWRSRMQRGRLEGGSRALKQSPVARDGDYAGSRDTFQA